MVQQFQITVTGDKHWARRTKAAATNISKIAIKPAFERLSQSLLLTLRTLFSTGGPGQAFGHGYTGAYGAAISKKVTNDALRIIEGIETGGQPILTGTGPVSVRDSHGNPVVPYGVVEWAMSKLSVGVQDAWAIGRSVAAHGIGHGGSPLLLEPPVGQGRMAFPEWTLDENESEINDAAERIGGLVIQYLDK